MRKASMETEFFKNRRRRMAALTPNCAIVLPAWPEYYRNADNTHNYRVESNLYYLTGFDEPECCLIFRPGKTPETTMFVRAKDITRETWDGFRFGVDGARSAFGFDQTFDIKEFHKLAPDLLKGCDKVYYTMFRNTEFDEKFGQVMMGMYGWRPRYGFGLPPIYDAHSVVGELRMRKTEEEADLMRKAASITSEAHIELMKATRPGVTERSLQGLFIKEIMDRGATGEAYSSIVATGNNATTLHYRFNESVCQEGEVLLNDCGAEYMNYSGDITRSYPVSGKFKPAQQRVYEKILKLQKEVVSMVKPGVPYFNLQKHTIEGSIQILIEEKLLSGTIEDNLKSAAYHKYYPHGVSHLLGLDTHDSGVTQVQGQSRPIEAGWCLTIEPGLYFPATDSKVPEELRGLGIRIEDDILVTEDGCENLTTAVPKDVEAMAELIGQNYR